MSSDANVTALVPAQPQQVISKIDAVLAAEKATPVSRTPDGLQTRFSTKKTLFSWALAGHIILTPTPQGTQIGLGLSEEGGHQKALLDGVKNRKKAQKLLELITEGL